VWCLVTLLSLGAVAFSQNNGTEKAVAALERKWLEAEKTNSPDLVAPLIADRFISTSSEGQVSDKAKWLADAKATKYDSVDHQNLKVTAFGDTAIATGTSWRRVPIHQANR
jgi:hypothetical protein